MRKQDAIIAASVVALHIFLILFIMADLPFEKRLPISRKLTIQTVKLKEAKQKEIVQAAKATPIVAAVEEAEEEKPQEISVEEKPKPQKKKAARPAPPSPPAKKQKSKTLSAKEKDLLKNLEESIEKIGKNTDKRSKPLEIEVPKEILSLEIENPFGALSFEKSYQDDLAIYLRHHLLLPEHGDIKVDLTLDRKGKVMDVKILKSKSERNKKYIEKTLSDLSFPSFGENFKNEKQHTFTLTLKSES